MQAFRLGMTLAAALAGFGLATGTIGPARAENEPTVAVVDFIAADGTPDSPILGVADLIEAELGQHHVRVISRLNVSLLLGERGLVRGGMARLEDFRGGALPWADFLLRGDVRSSADGSPTVHIRLVDAKTGLERGAWPVAGERPGDILREVRRVLPEIVAAISGKAATPSPRSRDHAGFTAIPEAAATFYRGLDHLMGGRPEYAAEYFRLAVTDDPSFALAVIGQAKAWERLGFPRVAAALMHTLPSETGSAAHAGDAVSTLTVRFVERSGAFPPERMERVRACLRDRHGFALFEPDWIPSLTRETDLKLSGEFPLVHGLDERLWLRADAMLVFAAGEQQLRASAIDLVGGRWLGSTEGTQEDVEELCARAVELLRTPGGTPQPEPAVTTNAAVARPEASLSFTYSVEETAFALRRLSEQPADLARWAHALTVLKLPQMPSAAVLALLDGHDAAIPANAPEAPVWLAASCWSRFFLAMQGVESLPDLEPYFGPLLRAYPDGLQAQVVRFQIARLRSARGRPEGILAPAVEAAEKAAAAVADMDDFVPLRGQYLDCVNRLDYGAFPNVLPPEGPRMRMLAFDMYALAAYLCALAGDTARARAFMDRAAPLERLTWASSGRVEYAGRISIYPVHIGIWQTGHIGYQWVPSDPTDIGRVLVGWSFMPYAMPDAGKSLAAAPSTRDMLQQAREMLAAVKPAAPAPVESSHRRLPFFGRKPPPPAASAAPAPARGKPLSMEEQAIAEHLDAPGTMERIHDEIRRRQAEGQRQRQHPHIAPTGDIFFSRPNELIYYDRHAGRAGRPLDVMDAFSGNITPSMLLIGKFVMETLQALERDGTQGGLRFATDFIASHVQRREEIVRTWDGLDGCLVEMYWMTAGAQDLTGDQAGARKTIRQALDLDSSNLRAWSLHYMDARAALGDGLDFEASEILRKLAEDPVSKRMPLTLPGESQQRGTVYAESVALLESIRRKSGQPAAGGAD